MIYLLAYVIYTSIGMGWFLYRMGDKHGSNKWWYKVFILPLDALLITPLLPYAALIGVLFHRKKT